MYDIEKSVGFLLAKAYQRGWAMFKEELDPYGLTPPQFSLLAFLWQKDGLSQVELSERSQIDRTTICGLIDRLEKLGMVQRMRNPDDRRSYRICLSDEGKRLEVPLSKAATRTVEQFTAGLTADERQEIIRLLDIMRGERKGYAPLGD